MILVINAINYSVTALQRTEIHSQDTNVQSGDDYQLQFESALKTESGKPHSLNNQSMVYQLGSAVTNVVYFKFKTYFILVGVLIFSYLSPKSM